MWVVLALLAPALLGQQDWGAEFRRIPSAARAIENEQIYTSLPHLAGSVEDFKLAKFTLERFEESFPNASYLDPHEVLLTYPLASSISMTSPVPYDCVIREPVIPVDPTSGDDRIVMPFNGYSPSGTVASAVVYVNYGRPEDYLALPSNGTMVRGKIVMVRYGKLFRGLKVRIAQEFGAVGVIIYSDPQDDGYIRGPVFPEGPWRPPGSVQRGSTQFLSICPGDPRTEECGGNVTDHVPSIPVQPIGYGDAEHLLRNLGGKAAPSSFQGGLNFTYTIGGEGNSVTLKVEANWTTTTIWNVCTEIKGVDNSSYVLIGNHRDAWTFGATDPNSGSSVVLEVVRAFGELSKSGFVPERTIKVCSWDGEEYGLLGSTSYAMQHKQDLIDNCVAYINTDVAVAGSYLVAGATPSVCSVVQEVLAKIVDPSSGKVLSDLYPFKPFPGGQVKALGSGSDYTSFLHHLGIVSIDWGFKDRDSIAPYHSAYDDLYWENRFGAANRTYDYFVVLAQLIGSTAIELAGSKQALDMSLANQALMDYFSILQSQMNNASVSFDLTALKSAIQSFGGAVAAGKFTPQQTFMVERQFLSLDGLPKRPFYRNLIQAPGINLGYGSLTFPGPSQAILDEDVEVGQQQTAKLAAVISAAASFLNQV